MLRLDVYWREVDIEIECVLEGVDVEIGHVFDSEI